MLLRAVSTKITIGAAATVAALGLAPLAHADDTLFINVLDKEGVEYNSPTNAKVMGEAVWYITQDGSRSSRQGHAPKTWDGLLDWIGERHWDSIEVLS